MYKAKNNILSCSLSETVTLREIINNLKEKSDFQRYKPSPVYFGTETLNNLGPKIWQLVPNEIKESSTLSAFNQKLKIGLQMRAPVGCESLFEECRVFIMFIQF